MNQPAPGAQSDLIGRVVALTVVVVVFGVWAWYTLGWPLSVPAVLLGVAAALTAANRIIDTLFGKQVLEAAREQMRARLGRALSWRIVAVAAGVVVVTGAMVSSVEVRPAPDDIGEVRLIPSLTRAPRELTSTQRFPVITPPWGRAFAVDADGYVRGTVRAYPILVRRVDLARDVQRMPSVLFRPGADGISLLGGGAILNVWAVDDDGSRELIATDSSRSRSSYVLGLRRPIADTAVERWRREFGSGPPPEAVDAIIALWRQPKQLRALHAVEPDGRLVAEIVSNGIVVSSADVRLRAERVLDAAMRDVLND